MQREILFRGKRENNGKWVYGSYHYCDQTGIMRTRQWGTVLDIIETDVKFNSHWILMHHTPDTAGWDIRDTFTPYAVIPETVAMWTGFNDVKGNKIFPGDIFGNIIQLRCVVEQRKDGEYRLVFVDKRITSISICDDKVCKSEIQGNIHDNPELVNPTSGEAGNNHMVDPKEVQEGAISPAPQEIAATESAAQDKAMEVNSEEVTEG